MYVSLKHGRSSGCLGAPPLEWRGVRLSFTGASHALLSTGGHHTASSPLQGTQLLFNFDLRFFCWRHQRHWGWSQTLWNHPSPQPPEWPGSPPPHLLPTGNLKSVPSVRKEQILPTYFRSYAKLNWKYVCHISPAWPCEIIVNISIIKLVMYIKEIPAFKGVWKQCLIDPFILAALTVRILQQSPLSLKVPCSPAFRHDSAGRYECSKSLRTTLRRKC